MTEFKPGAWFTGVDGNYNTVTDARIPEEDEATDFLLDREGHEIREGDYVMIQPGHNWAGSVCVVERVQRGAIYTGRHESAVPGAWSPQAPLNSVGIVRDSHHWAARPSEMVKVNLTDQDTKRMQLEGLLSRRAALAVQAVEVEQKLAGINLEIAITRATLREGAER